MSTTESTADVATSTAPASFEAFRYQPGQPAPTDQDHAQTPPPPPPPPITRLSIAPPPQLGQDQRDAFLRIVQQQHSGLVLASAGCGKSFLIHAIMGAMKDHFSVFLCAPTSGAAFLLNCTTVHSLFGIRVRQPTIWKCLLSAIDACSCLSADKIFNRALFHQPAIVTDLDAFEQLWNRTLEKANLMRQLPTHDPTCRFHKLWTADLIMIDEISMAQTLESIDIILRVITGHMETPFGGKQVVGFGDLRQLPCVITSEDHKQAENDLAKHQDIVWDDPPDSFICTSNYLRAAASMYVHQFESFNHLRSNIMELTQAFRQDGHWYELLQRMRYGKVRADIDLPLLRDRLVAEYELARQRAINEQLIHPGSDMTALFGTNREVEDHNYHKLRERRQSRTVILTPYCIARTIDATFTGSAPSVLASPIAHLHTTAFQWNAEPSIIPSSSCKIPPVATLAIGARVITCMNVPKCDELPRNRMGTVIRLGRMEGLDLLSKEPIPVIIPLRDQSITVQNLYGMYGRTQAPDECASAIETLERGLLRAGFVEDQKLDLNPSVPDTLISWSCRMVPAVVVLLDPTPGQENREIAIVPPQKHEATVNQSEQGYIGTIDMWSIPFKLAFACTVHSVQGTTMSTAMIKLSPFMTRTPAMFYVAMSRVRNIQGLFLAGSLDWTIFRCDPSVQLWERRHLTPLREKAFQRALHNALQPGSLWSRYFAAPTPATTDATNDPAQHPPLHYRFNKSATCITIHLQKQRGEHAAMTEHACETIDRDLLLRSGGTDVKWSIMCPSCCEALFSQRVCESEVLEQEACRRWELVAVNPPVIHQPR
jgi:hypothetical protein